MDQQKVGALLKKLRYEKGLTQAQLAQLMNISDKTISKWERGMGCPDISLLGELSAILNVNIEKMLIGDLNPNNTDGGNMKNIKFYTCATCGNILTATASAELSCCGRKLEPLVAQKADGKHKLNVENIENDYYITFEHEMTKEHYLNFVAYVSYDRVFLVRLYPEQGSELRIPAMRSGKIYFGCNKHGLWVNE